MYVPHCVWTCMRVCISTAPFTAASMCPVPRLLYTVTEAAYTARHPGPVTSPTLLLVKTDKHIHTLAVQRYMPVDMGTKP